MAESGDEQAQIIQTFKNFVKSSGGGKAMTEDQLNEITDKGVNKMLKACCSDTVAKAGEAQVFTAVNKKAKKMSLDTFLNVFLPELAATVLHNEMTKKDRAAKKLGLKEEPVVTKLNKIRKDIAAKHDSMSAGVAVSGVTQRLTDTSKYTGSHQSRFGSDGKGKGLEGREDRSDNSGYVGGYKNEGSYATKK